MERRNQEEEEQCWIWKKYSKKATAACIYRRKRRIFGPNERNGMPFAQSFLGFKSGQFEFEKHSSVAPKWRRGSAREVSTYCRLERNISLVSFPCAQRSTPGGRGAQCTKKEIYWKGFSSPFCLFGGRVFHGRRKRNPWTTTLHYSSACKGPLLPRTTHITLLQGTSPRKHLYTSPTEETTGQEDWKKRELYCTLHNICRGRNEENRHSYSPQLPREAKLHLPSPSLIREKPKSPYFLHISLQTKDSTMKYLQIIIRTTTKSSAKETLTSR